MEKDTKVVLSVVLVLLVAAVSFNFFNNEPATGQFHRSFRVDSAEFVGQEGVPTQMNVGESIQVRITMRNNGVTSWTSSQDYKLGFGLGLGESPWGLGRVELSPSEVITPGNEKTFVFTITAPSASGVYNFQWQMLREGIAYFGGLTQNVRIEVLPLTPTLTSQTGVGIHTIQSLEVVETIKTGSLRGLGNAYVCTHSDGVLYRSSAPCS